MLAPPFCLEVVAPDGCPPVLPRSPTQFISECRIFLAPPYLLRSLLYHGLKAGKRHNLMSSSYWRIGLINIFSLCP
jgi:hypothetical protein